MKTNLKISKTHKIMHLALKASRQMADYIICAQNGKICAQNQEKLYAEFEKKNLRRMPGALL